MKARLLYGTLYCTMLSLALAGCGGDSPYDGPQRFPLSGKVSFDGQPVDGGMISFLPMTTGAQPSGGPIIGGEYSVPEPRGAVEGLYRVEIRWPRPTGKKFKDSDTGEMVDVMTEAIPPRYNVNSELQAQVSESQTSLDFELKKP